MQLAPLVVSLLTSGLAGLIPTPALAYTPGTGTLYNESFDDGVANDWTGGDGISAEPWKIALFGAPGNRVWLANGTGQFPISPTLTKAWRLIHPVPATSFSVAFYYRADGGTNFIFQVDIEQRAPIARFYRLQIDATGRLSLQRSNNGPYTILAQSAANFVPFGADRWMRFEIASVGGSETLRARVWSGSATAEPATWDLSAADPLATVERVHRLTFTNDGPKTHATRIDDLDIWGDGSQGVVSSIKTIYICEWSHLDIGFTLPPEQIEQFYKDSLDQVLANLDADPGYKWTIESYWMLEKWMERTPADQQQRMFDYLRSGRIHLLGGYANLTVGHMGYEEFARPLYWAKDLARRESFPIRGYIQDDVPGSPFSVPEMLAKTGIEYYFGGMNTPFGGVLTHPSMAERPFWWQGPDGSRVLAWHTFDSYAEAFDYGFSWFDDFNALYTKLGTKLPDNEAIGYPHDTLMIMKAFDNNYTGLAVKQKVDQWNATYATPKFVLAQPEEFMDVMKAKLGGAIPTFTGDYGPAWSAGSGNHDMQDVRTGHHAVRSGEALSAVADLIGAGSDPRPALKEAYRQLIVWDEHSGGGSWPGYFNSQEMTDTIAWFQNLAAGAKSASQTAIDTASSAIASRVPSPGRNSLVVLNGLTHVRDVWVRASLPPDIFNSTFRILDRAAGGVERVYQRFPATSEILFRATALPSLGYRVYDLAPGTPAAQPSGTLTVSGTQLENDFYRLTVDPADGSVSSLVWKTSGAQLVDPAATYKFNRLAHATNTDIFYATPPTVDNPSSATVTIGDAGPLVASLEVARQTTPHDATTYLLYRGEDRVEIQNEIERDRMPYVAGGATMTYTVSLPFNIHNFSLRTERTNRFFDPPNDNFPRSSFFAFHDAEHTLDFWDNALGITYACPETPTHDFERMAATEPSIPLTKALLFPRLMNKTDEYQYDDNQYHPVDYEPGTSPFYGYHHHFRAHPPGHDPVAAVRFGFDVLSPAPVRLIRDQTGDLPADSASFLECDDPSVNWYTVKRAETGAGLVLRIAEITGQARTVRIFSSRLELTNPRTLSWVEDDQGPLQTDGNGFDVVLGPYETVTVGVDASFAIALAVTKDVAGGNVHLTWTGGGGPFEVDRARHPDFSDGAPVGSGVAGRSFDDPVLGDGVTYFYLVH